MAMRTMEMMMSTHSYYTFHSEDVETTTAINHSTIDITLTSIQFDNTVKTRPKRPISPPIPILLFFLLVQLTTRDSPSTNPETHYDSLDPSSDLHLRPGMLANQEIEVESRVD